MIFDIFLLTLAGGESAAGIIGVLMLIGFIAMVIQTIEDEGIGFVLATGAISIIFYLGHYVVLTQDVAGPGFVLMGVASIFLFTYINKWSKAKRGATDDEGGDDS